MQATTQIVTIPKDNLEELTTWVNNHGGTLRKWDLIQGNHGRTNVDTQHPSLERYLKLQVAADNPEMACPKISEMDEATVHTLLQAAVDSYEWMYEGHFDSIDLPEVMTIIAANLRPRVMVEPADVREQVRYLRENPATQDMPDWESMTPIQKALVSEAFQDSATEWDTQSRLNSNVQDALSKHLRRQPAQISS